MKILLADAFEEWGIEQLRAGGFVLQSDPALTGRALAETIARESPEVLIVRGTQVTGEMLAASARLGLVVRAGAGTNTIDIAAASARGILVANCPGKNAVAVAELTFALILALDRRIVESVAELRAGAWNKKEYGKARGLKDRTLGLLGMGQIGRAVVRRARAFEMNVVAWSRSLSDELAAELGVVRCEGPAQVASRCDILSIHLAAHAETKNLVSAAVLDRLRPGSYVVNTARADVMDYQALAAAVEKRGLRVGLDVYPNEPSGGSGEFADEIVKARGVVYGTHHIGASTDQAQDAIAAETIRIVKVFAATGHAPNCVNIATTSRACCQLVVRHHDKVGVLAAVLDKLRRAGINVQEMSNTIFQGGGAAVASIRLGDRPAPELVREIESMDDLVIQAQLMKV